MIDKEIGLNGTIAPQMFGKQNDDIFIFDKINHQEGIFYKYSKNGKEIIYETQEGQGIILGDGKMFFITLDNESTVYSVSNCGVLEEQFKLQGIFYDIKLNNSGNFICLGNVEGKSIIKIIKVDGVELSSFYPNEIIFASCIYPDDDYIYVGGFDDKNIFNILMINYANITIKKWRIECKSKDRIINKIQKWNDKLILSISGQTDDFVVIDLDKNDYRVISPKCINRINIIDFNIYNDFINILDGVEIYNYKIEDILDAKEISKTKNIKKTFEYAPYAYLMNLYSFQNNIKNNLLIYFITFIFYLYFLSPWLKTSDFKSIILTVSLYWVISLLIILCLSMFSLSNKAKRVEYLLKISGNYQYKYALVIDSLIGFLFSLNYFIMEQNDYNFVIWSITLVILITAFIFVRTKSNKIVYNRKDIIIELLKDEDRKIQDYVRKTVNTINMNKDEKIKIQITADEKIMSKYIDNWIKSRRYIIGKDINFNIEGKLISTSLDFSNRDIRYSKFTIVMDYISYIKIYFKVKEIEIIFPGEYNKEKTD